MDLIKNSLKKKFMKKKRLNTSLNFVGNDSDRKKVLKKQDLDIIAEFLEKTKNINEYN